MEKLDWETYFLDIADLVALKSKDPSTKVGAVIVYPDNGVCSTGFNDHPRGVEDHPERRERPVKYLYTEHAERNAIYNAAKQGHSTNGCTMYVQTFPCADCARAIIQAGIKKLITPAPDMSMPQWKDSWDASVAMLDEAGVQVDYYFALTAEQ